MRGDDGIGVALLPDFLVQKEIDAGMLAVVIDKPLRCAESYYVAYPLRQETNPTVLGFVDWIVSECQAFKQERESRASRGAPSAKGRAKNIAQAAP